jgi:hypothetical protein
VDSMLRPMLLATIVAFAALVLAVRAEAAIGG